MSNTHQTLAGALLTIDLDAICDNWRTLRAKIGAASCGAVVKADAYGLGALQVAPALYRAGCRHFFVAHLSEAIDLRPALPADATLYVLHGAHPGSEAEFAHHGLVPVLNSLPQLLAWRRLAKSLERKLPAVLQVDTGMARLGLAVDELDALANDPSALEGIELRYVVSHLASAEVQDNPLNRLQLERFRAALERLPATGACLANSSGIFLGPEYHFDLVRPGAALYGVAPVAGAANPMRQVIRLQGKVVQTRTIAPRTGVGYNHTWTAPEEARIATVSVGYADGYLRSLGNRGYARFEDTRLPIVGNISMDTITLDISALPAGRITEGCLVDLADALLGVDEIATRAGTIGYEILTSLGSRYARHYLGQATGNL